MLFAVKRKHGPYHHWIVHWLLYENECYGKGNPNKSLTPIRTPWQLLPVGKTTQDDVTLC